MAKWASGDSATSTEHKIEEFAEDLGGLLGTARAKAEGWLGQRQEIVKHLSEIRDTATKLLSDLLDHAQDVVHRGRRGRPQGSQNHIGRGTRFADQRRRQAGRSGPCLPSPGLEFRRHRRRGGRSRGLARRNSRNRHQDNSIGGSARFVSEGLPLVEACVLWVP